MKVKGFTITPERPDAERAAAQCREVHQQLVARPRDLHEVQADELRIKRQGADHLFDLTLLSDAELIRLDNLTARVADGDVLAEG